MIFAYNKHLVTIRRDIMLVKFHLTFESFDLLSHYELLVTNRVFSFFYEQPL